MSQTRGMQLRKEAPNQTTTLRDLCIIKGSGRLEEEMKHVNMSFWSPNKVASHNIICFFELCRHNSGNLGSCIIGISSEEHLLASWPSHGNQRFPLILRNCLMIQLCKDSLSCFWEMTHNKQCCKLSKW